MKKPNFSDIELEIIRKSVRRNIKPREISVCLSLGKTLRSVDSIIEKIWRMGLVYPDQEKLRLEKPRKIHTKQYHLKKTSRQEREQLLSKGDNYTDKWQTALKLSRAKMIEKYGQKLWTIDGRPVTIQDIMRYLPTSS